MATEPNAAPMMDEAAYLKERVENQQNWYDRKSSMFQRKYKRMKAAVIILSGLLPLGAGFINQGGIVLQVLVGAMGTAVAILEGMLSLNQYHENWLNYRKSAEFLKREMLLFQTRAGAYAYADDSFRLLVQRVEDYLTFENQQWGENMKPGDKDN